MRAGLLRQRVVIQRETVTKDALGGDVQTWSTLTTVWAEVRPLSGREAIEAGRISSTANVWITVRYRDDITPLMRVIWRGRTFEINQIENQGAGDVVLVLWCSEVQGLVGQVA